MAFSQLSSVGHWCSLIKGCAGYVSLLPIFSTHRKMGQLTPQTAYPYLLPLHEEWGEESPFRSWNWFEIRGTLPGSFPVEEANSECFSRMQSAHVQSPASWLKDQSVGCSCALFLSKALINTYPSSTISAGMWWLVAIVTLYSNAKVLTKSWVFTFSKNLQFLWSFGSLGSTVMRQNFNLWLVKMW